MSPNPWIVDDVESVVALDTEAIDRALADAVDITAGSSGWICTLTMECGTYICSCRRC